MTEAVQISQTAPARASMNYAALREGGMELIRALARDTWTDHNAHDPGITLLEAFSYAMTELGFRIQLDMSDLLQSGARHVPPNLVPAHRVLPCAPVTPRDLRGVLLDHRLLRDARIITNARAEIPYYEIPHGNEIPASEVPAADPPFAYAPNAAQVVLRGLYEAVLEFAERELNSNTYTMTVTTAGGADYNVDMALPHWDEPEAAPFQNSPVVNSVIMLVDGGEVWRPLDESQTYFGAMEVNYTGAGSPAVLSVLLRITDVLSQPALVTLDDILTAAQRAVQNTGPDTLIDRYAQRVRAAYSAVKQVQRYLSIWRNLCEDPVRIAVARVQEIAVRARIEVNGSTDLEQLLADIYFAIDRMLAPPVRFVALAERRATGAGVEQIFDGPLLRNGFLDEATLAADDARAIHISDILRLIMRRRNVAGTDLVAQENPSGRDIVAVTDLALSNYINNRPITVDAQNCLHLVEIERYRPRLSLSKSRIVFMRNEVEVPYDMGRVKSLFNAMQQAEETASLPADPSPVWPVASGEALPVEDYTPLQNDLPRIYGVGEACLPEDVGVERQAAVLQLKGYLLLFEQFLADLTAQLGNINRFFSADPDEQETYFCRALFELPDVQKLLTRNPPGGDWAAFIAAPDNPYRSALHQAQEGPERFLDRRNRMFDHLLARQGEEMVAFCQELHRYAQKELQGAVIAPADLPARMEARRQVANARLIRAKAALLGDAPMLNHARLQALGNPLQRRADILRIDKNGAHYRWTLVLAGQEQLRSTTDFTTAAAAAIAAEDAAVLAAQEAWYSSVSAGGGRRRYCLQDSNGTAARVIGESPQTYPSVAAAQDAAQACAQSFAVLRLGESQTPLERRIAHLCGIRSRVRRRLVTDSAAFFDIYDEVDSDGIIEKRWRLWEQPGYSGRVMLSSVYHYEAPTDGEAIDKAKTSIQEVVRYGQDEWNYAVAPAGTNTYNFELWHPAGTKLGLRNPPFLSGEASQQGLEETLTHLYHFYSAEGFHLVEHLLLRPRQSDETFLSFPAGPDTLERDPYSQRLSLVFPSGYMRDFSLPAGSAPRYDTAPHRFRDPEFRRHVERMVQQSCPAHLLPSIFWVDRQAPGTTGAPKSFDSFEQRYLAWLGTVLVPGAAPAAITLAREDLIEALNGIAHG